MEEQISKFVSQHIGVSLVGLIIGALGTMIFLEWLKTAEGWRRSAATTGFAIASVTMIAGGLPAMVFLAAALRAM